MNKQILACLLLLIVTRCYGASDGIPYSFSEPPFINPKIVEELTTWVSDHDDQVVAIDLLHSQDCNKFFCENTEVINVTNENPFVRYDVDESDGYHSFGYRHVGTTPAGIHVLETAECSGGSANWVSLVFLVFEADYGLSMDSQSNFIQLSNERLLLKKLGDIFLGDRWAGGLELDGNRLVIGKDHGNGGDRLGWPLYTNDWTSISGEVERVVTIGVDYKQPDLSAVVRRIKALDKMEMEKFQRELALERETAEAAEPTPAATNAQPIVDYGPLSYTIQEGDTLSSICELFIVSEEAVRKVNPDLQLNEDLNGVKRLLIPENIE